VVSEQSSLSCFSLHVPNEVGYKELGLELVEPLQDQPLANPLMTSHVEENKDEGVGDPFKILLEEALE
jgi:hypothetical protein